MAYCRGVSLFSRFLSNQWIRPGTLYFSVLFRKIELWIAFIWFHDQRAKWVMRRISCSVLMSFWELWLLGGEHLRSYELRVFKLGFEEILSGTHSSIIELYSLLKFLSRYWLKIFLEEHLKSCSMIMPLFSLLFFISF